MRTQEQLMNLGLPKWPQMLVTGTTLPVNQALEIIRRTDDFFSCPTGNDRPFIARARKLCYMPDDPFDNLKKYNKADGSRDEDQYLKAISNYYDEFDKWKKYWGTISFEFLINSWISCPFVGGPHGWCHPNGTIGFSDNVGKYPSVEEIFNEWSTVAYEFPFVELEATLMSDEEGCNGHPVVSFLIRNGRVEIIDPKVRNIHEEFNREIPGNRDMKTAFMNILTKGNGREHAIPLNQLMTWGNAFAARHQEYIIQERRA